MTPEETAEEKKRKKREYYLRYKQSAHYRELKQARDSRFRAKKAQDQEWLKRKNEKNMESWYKIPAEERSRRLRLAYEKAKSYRLEWLKQDRLLNPEKHRAYKHRTYTNNLLANRERSRLWREQNKSWLIAWGAAYRSANRDKIKEWMQAYKQRPEWKLQSKVYWLKRRDQRNVYKRTPKYREWARSRDRERHKTDPQYIAKKRCRSRLHTALLQQNTAKRAKTFDLIGCSVSEFVAHMEAQFRPGMCWGNIHIDHIKPCSEFDLSSLEQQKLCFRYANMQPLFAEENLQKGSHWPWSVLSENESDEMVVAG
jgi:hypothetical protein